MLNRRGYPRAALSLFRAERTLLDWFTPSEAQAADKNVSLVSFDFAGAKTDDPPARPSDDSAAFLTWNRARVQERKAEWFELRRLNGAPLANEMHSRRMRFRGRSKNRLSELPTNVVP